MQSLGRCGVFNQKCSKPVTDFLTQYIADEAHYKEVIARMGAVKRELWVGTADIKDVYIKQGRGEAAPLLGL